MAGLSIFIRILVVFLVSLFLTRPANAQCNTNQNPYCAGQPQFEQLCCTYPNICYWSDRGGTPACCQAGSDCRGDGGPAPIVVFTAVQQTTLQTTYLVQTVYTTTQPQYSTVTYYSHYQPTTTSYIPAPVFTSISTIVTPAVVVVTQSAVVVAPVTTAGVYLTVTQPVNNGAFKLGTANCCSWIVFGTFMLAYGMDSLV